MHKVIIFGAGKIGELVSVLLSETRDFEVHIADVVDDFSSYKAQDVTYVRLDVKKEDEVSQYCQKHGIQSVLSALPFYLNTCLARVAKTCHLNYFDLTEDTEVTDAVRELAEGAQSAFVPQCGLAPGFVGIVANYLINQFDRVEQVKLRVGALPENSSNSLHYALTWSTEGVINEYGNACEAVVNGGLTLVSPLEGLEKIQINGREYEAFNTSGGLGSLALLHQDKVSNMNYKTIRYPGHCEKMRVLMFDLKLNEDRETLGHILERAVPRTAQDVVHIYVSAEGYRDRNFFEENYFKTIRPSKIGGRFWSAIQVSTAASLCAIVDIVLNHKNEFKGFVYQEHISYEEFLANRFGQYYA